MTPLSHLELRIYMQKLGYWPNYKGVCFGLAAMGIQAMLSCDLKSFEQRLLAIKKDMVNGYRLGKLVYQPNIQGCQGLSAEDIQTLTDIRAFCDGVELYYAPRRYPKLFEFKNAPTTQNIRLTSPLVSSIAIQEEQGLYQADSFVGMYTQLELAALFQALKEEILVNNAIPVALEMENSNHAIAIGYDSISNEWIFIDVNSLPPFRINREEDLARYISAAFDSVSGYIGISAKIYSTFDNKHTMDGIIRVWQQKDAWHNAHTLTSDKINKKADRAGTALLYLAAQQGSLDTVTALLERKVDVNQANINGATSLHIAAQEGHLEVVSALLDHHEIDVNHVSNNRATPLHTAAQNGHLEVVEALLGHAANINQVDINGATALYIASQNGHLEVVEVFLEHRDVDVNQARHNGMTPLHAAAQNDHLEVIEVLRKSGASVYKNRKRPRDEDGSDKQRTLMFSEGVRKRQRTNDEEVGNDDSNQPIHVNRILPNF